MVGRRSNSKGNFGDHLDELVKQFEHEPTPGNMGRSGAAEDVALQEKKDIHGKLFERAWLLDGENRDNSAP